eukprot:NODE_1857_length_1378_cov_75.558315_g1680_i0.p1 GENE.NODE_1857_length_1378_cov_75.558315_g1680_i0~~NODE_1857_length_1378_cov_75.558315_g1680_i0.p1  ORF type:complete len:421 (+),score=87.62 NODE_1857_length_1378_cov_75.558315_g1680_i0:59-1264(+)
MSDWEKTDEKVAKFLRAVQEGNHSLVSDFLRNQPQLLQATDATGRTGMHFAAHGNHSSIIEQLAAAGADVSVLDLDGLTPLMLAAKRFKASTLQSLLNCKADINFANKRNVTALHHAAASGDLRSIEFFLESGASISSKATEAGSVLHWAAQSGQVECVALFLDEQGMDVDLPDANKGTALHTAVATDSLDLVVFLLERGADPNAVAQGGCTPLHLATEISNKVEVVRALVTFGATISHDEAGETPLLNAEQRGKPEFVRELEKVSSTKSAQHQEEQAAKFKDQGNKAFKAGEYFKSIRFYTLAISYSPRNHTFFSNRSASYYNLRKMELALADANQCIRLKPDWSKGYFRKGASLILLGKLSLAKKVLEQGLKMDPTNTDLKQALSDVVAKEVENKKLKP